MITQKLNNKNTNTIKSDIEVVEPKLISSKNKAIKINKLISPNVNSGVLQNNYLVLMIKIKLT